MPLALYADHAEAAEPWDRCIDVNLKGVLHGIIAVYDQMIAQGRGHVVTVSSIYGNHPVVGAAVYGARKAAVIVLSESLRQESQLAGAPGRSDRLRHRPALGGVDQRSHSSGIGRFVRDLSREKRPGGPPPVHWNITIGGSAFTAVTIPVVQCTAAVGVCESAARSESA